MLVLRPTAEQFSSLSYLPCLCELSSHFQEGLVSSLSLQIRTLVHCSLQAIQKHPSQLTIAQSCALQPSCLRAETGPKIRYTNLNFSDASNASLNNDGADSGVSVMWYQSHACCIEKTSEANSTRWGTANE